MADRRLRDLGLELDLDELLLCYGDHLGDPLLREAVAAGGDGLAPDDVLVTAGAAAALFCTATTLLEPGDHAVVVRTNYATNLETPRAIGADLDVVDLRFDDGWRLDVEQVAARVRDGETRLISVTQPHNPTGTMFDLATLDGLVDAGGALGRGAARGRDLPRPHPRRAAPARPPRCRRACVSVSSMSKAYGLPGPAHRMGDLPRPRAGRAAAGGQGAGADLRRDARRADRRHGAGRREPRCCRRSSTTCARGSRSCGTGWPAQSTFEWVEPAGGVVGLVRVPARGRRSTPTGSTTCCSPSTAPTSGPATGSSSTTATSASATAGPRTAELHAGLAALTAAAASRRPESVRVLAGYLTIRRTSRSATVP